MSEPEESQIYSPESSKGSERGAGVQGYKRRVQKTNEHTVEGKWTEEENLKYILFMDYHSKVFASKEKRKSTRIFKTLSKLLATRTPRQCRSHFQKIMNKFKRINHIKGYYVSELGHEEYLRRYEELVSELEPLKVKQEETQKALCTKANAEVQTDPMNIQLKDLPNCEIMKLLNIFQEYQKTQLPFFLPPPPFPRPHPN